jgi:hypothetical protein
MERKRAMKAQLKNGGGADPVIAEVDVADFPNTPDLLRWNGRWFKSIGVGFGTIYVYEETTGIDLSVGR